MAYQRSEGSSESFTAPASLPAKREVSKAGPNRLFLVRGAVPGTLYDLNRPLLT